MRCGYDCITMSEKSLIFSKFYDCRTIDEWFHPRLQNFSIKICKFTSDIKMIDKWSLFKVFLEKFRENLSSDITMIVKWLMNDHYSKTWLQNPTKSQKRLMNDYYTLKISQSAIALRPRSLSEMLGIPMQRFQRQSIFMILKNQILSIKATLLYVKLYIVDQKECRSD